MKTKKTGTTIKHLITFALIFLLGIATSVAQEKFKIAGKQTLAFTKQERIMIGDIDGHVLSLAEAQGVNQSTGASEFMDGAQVINVVSSDLVNFSGPVEGYSIVNKGNDSFYAKIEGKLTTTVSSDGSPLTTIEATMTWIKGTGKYEGVKGGGTAKGRYIAPNIYIMEWEGEYWIEK
ncbi:MAG: hypothetical protein EA394_03885 [Bacteroidia bacterium]|nr:MAG: hypothetical protein EA394_03885 [Bacteroidia bacterium]